LDMYRIGNLDTSNQNEADILDSNDPYSAELKFQRNPALVVRSQKPFNAETPRAILADSLITPNELFYIRNHLPVPIIDPKQHELVVSCECLDKPVRFTIDDLKQKFKAETFDVTIQCAGNRRNEMSKVKPVRGGFWDVGAISTASWTGVRLRDILLAAGVDAQGSGMLHVQFEGMDKDFEKNYGASIPIRKALDPYV
jgi:sulfite oxidase